MRRVAWNFILSSELRYVSASVSREPAMSATTFGGNLHKVVFITGTDTGVGKTVLTGLLLAHLRGAGCNAFAVKPFSAGGLRDAVLFNRLQGNELPMDLVAPFRFSEPVAPLVSLRKQHANIELQRVLEKIRLALRRSELLLVEGIGGLLVPIAKGLTVSDLIFALGCPVIVVARNHLGTINHTLLTVQVLRTMSINVLKVVLMDGAKGDGSKVTNQEVLKILLDPIEVLRLPYLGRTALKAESIKNNSKKLKKLLARCLRFK